MSSSSASRLPDILAKYESDILADWINEQLTAVTLRPDLMPESELRNESRKFLRLFGEAVNHADFDDMHGDGWSEVRSMLSEVSHSRARRGFTPSETASFVFSLKRPLFSRLRQDGGRDADGLAEDIWHTTVVLDTLGLYTTEVYQKGRDELIGRQQQEMLELSTPVVELWEGILALPLIGTLDSNRTQIVMENLLQKIVDTGAGIAIIDITGVPTVDTLVAQHLLKTVSAARLMGADCIISGIRPQIAQTIVHLGVELGSVVTKATLAGAFQVALQKTGTTIARARG